MATFGQTATPNFGWWWMGIGTSNQVCSQFAVPAAATITSLSCYMGGHINPVAAQCVMWDGPTGNLIRSAGSNFTSGYGASTPGGQGWHTQNITAYNANQGDNVWIGFWRDPSGRAEWSITGSGTFIVSPAAGTTVASPAGLAGNYNPGNPRGTIGAYATYTGNTGGGGGGGTTSRINLWNGTAWSQKPLNIWNGTAWVQKPLERWSGTVWG